MTTKLGVDILYNDRGAERGLRQLGDTTERTGKRFTGLKVAGAAALVAVGTAAVKMGGDSVRAFVDAEKSQARLTDAYRRFPKVTDVSLGSLQRLNEELARKTRFDDDATASGQAVLAQFDLTGRQITELTPLLQDYAAKTGKDMPTAARDLGKAVMGQGRALKNVGLDLKDTGTQTGNLDQLMRGLRGQVGGFAEREGKTAAGSMEILKNQTGELQEEAGQRLLPALLKVGGGLLRVVTYVQDSNGVFGSFRRITGAAFEAFSGSVGGGRSAFARFADYVSTNQAGITRGFVVGAKTALGIGDAVLTTASAALRGYSSIADGQADMTETVIGSMRSILRGATIAFGWIPGVGDRLKAADARFASFSDTAVGGLRRAASQGRSMADTIDDKLRPALGAAGRKIDEVGRKEIVKAETRDAVNRAAIAVRDLGTRSDGSQVKIRKFSDITRMSAGEQRAFRGRLNETRAALQAKVEKMRAAGSSSAELRREVGRSRDALYKEFRQMGLSREEARKLAERYSKVPRKIVTPVSAPNIDKIRDNVRGLDRDMDNISSKTVTARVNFTAGGTRVIMKKGTTGGGLVAWAGPSASASLNAAVGPGPNGGGPGVHEDINVRGLSDPRPPVRQMARGVVNHGIGRIAKAAPSMIDAPDGGDPGGRVGTRSVPGGWGPIYSAMRRHGARTFNTYPGHHPSMARARDVYPHSWAAANAARALSSVWYVIYRMKIASKNHGNVWRPYRPTNFRGDWRHVRHIHVARYDQGGELAPGQLGVNLGRRPERVLTARQTQTYDRHVRILERAGGAVTVHNTYNFPHYLGSQQDLKVALVQLAGRGQLGSVLQRAGVRT